MGNASKNFILFIIIFFGPWLPPGAADVSEPVVIGVLHSETFPYALMMRNSFEMAVRAKNKEGGIKGRPLELVYADDRGEREAGEAAVKQLVQKAGAVMLVGGYASSNTIYMARVADEADRPFLITTAADDRITQRKWANVYRMNPPVDEYARGVEELLQKSIKPASMAIVYENSPFGTGGAMRMMWFCRENDIEIRKLIPYHRERAGSSYFEGLLKPLRQEPPDVIYLMSYLEDAVLLVKTIRESGINAWLIGGAGGFTHHKFITMAGDAADGLLTATLWTHQLPYDGTAEYYNLYLEKYAVPPDYHGAEAYSALSVVADVLERADSLDPENIRRALDKTDMRTPFGPVKFEAYGKFERQNSPPTMVLQVSEGAFEVVWPRHIATSDLVTAPGMRSPSSEVQ